MRDLKRQDGVKGPVTEVLEHSGQLQTERDNLRSCRGPHWIAEPPAFNIRVLGLEDHAST